MEREWKNLEFWGYLNKALVELKCWGGNKFGITYSNVTENVNARVGFDSCCFCSCDRLHTFQISRVGKMNISIGAHPMVPYNEDKVLYRKLMNAWLSLTCKSLTTKSYPIISCRPFFVRSHPWRWWFSKRDKGCQDGNFVWLDFDS